MLSKILFLIILNIIFIIANLLDVNSAISISSQLEIRKHQKRSSDDFATRNDRRYGTYEVFDIEENDIAPKGAIECPPNYTGTYPYLMSCRQFLTCWKGRGTIQMCAPGTLFNAKTLECDYPLKVKCETFEGTYPSSQRQQNQPAGRGNQRGQSRFGDDGNNRNYVNNNNNNNNNKVECRPYTSGLYAHPYDCKKFLNCDRGTTHIQECGPGTVFNPIANVCDWPANVRCPETNNNNNNNNENNGEFSDDGEGLLDARIGDDQKSVDTNRLDNNNRRQQRPLYNRNQYGNRRQGATVANNRGYPTQSRSETHNYGEYENTLNPANKFYTTSNTMQTSSLRTPILLSSARPTTIPSYNNMHSFTTVSSNTNAAPLLPHANYPIISNSYSSVKTNHNSQNHLNNIHNNNNNNNKQYPSLSYNNDRFKTTTEFPYAPPPPPSQSLQPPHLTSTKADISPSYSSTSSNTSNNTLINNNSQNSTFGRLDEYIRLLNAYNEGQQLNKNSSSRPQKSQTVPLHNFPQNSINDTLTESLRLLNNYHNRNQLNTTNNDNIYPIYFRQSTTSTTLAPPFYSSSVNNKQSYPLNNYDYNNREIIQSNKQNRIPNPQTDYLPITDAIKALLRPYEHTAINTSSSIEITSNRTVKAMESELLKMIGGTNDKLSINYTEPYEQESLAKADFEYQQTMTNDRDVEQTTSITFIKKSPNITHPPHLHPHHHQPQPSCKHFHWPNQFFSRLNPINQIPFESKRTTVIEDTSASDSKLKIITDNNRQHQHSYEWHKQNNVPWPHQTITETESISTNEQDDLNRSPTYSSTNRPAPTITNSYPHRPNHQHRFQHSSSWHTAHNIPLPTVTESSNTPDLNDTDQIFSGTHQHPHHHHHHHNHQNHNYNDDQHSHHNHNHHHQQQHNNRNEFPYISTSTVPNSNLYPQYDFPSTGPTTFFYNRDITPTKNVPPPLLYDRFGDVGVSCDNGFNCENGLCISYDKVCDGRFHCGNRLDEQQCDHIGYEIRLSGEKISTNMGRIEVKVFDKWGYVCDDRFSIIDANVACRELGFTMGASEVRANSYYPPNENMLTNDNDPIMMMDEINCIGNETSLRECKFNGWGVHDCNAEEIVGVVCKVPIMKCPDGFWLCEASEECIPISFLCDTIADCKHGDDENSDMCNADVAFRLAGSEIDTLGRVEVKYHGMWGTICDDDFGNVEASVICRSLGFGGPASVIKSEFGIGMGPIWLDQISCYGNETSIDKCMHFEWGNHNCNHTEDVAVRCTPGNVNPITIVNTDDEASESNEYLVKMQRQSKVLGDEINTCGRIKLSNENNADDDDAAHEPGQFRVIGGKRAKRGNHPWQATIRAKDRRGKSAHWCGAVLISNIHLLTAAHCLMGFSKGALIIRIGDYNADVHEDTEVEIFIENMYIHEDFRRGQHMNNDIALVLFKSRISFTNYIQPVCLPTIETEYTPGMNCTISGWGSIRYGRATPSLELLSASLPIISDNVCRQPGIYGNAIMDGMFCAGFLEAEGTDACEGDSGGPLVCENNGVHVLYGIISWGHRCGDANKPGVYVKISHYLDWIGEQILQSISNT